MNFKFRPQNKIIISELYMLRTKRKTRSLTYNHHGRITSSKMQHWMYSHVMHDR
jgi:hypothetical protein